MNHPLSVQTDSSNCKDILIGVKLSKIKLIESRENRYFVCSILSISKWIGIWKDTNRHWIQLVHHPPWQLLKLGTRPACEEEAGGN